MPSFTMSILTIFFYLCIVFTVSLQSNNKTGNVSTKNLTLPNNEFTAADEEIGGNHGPAPIHILDRGIFASLASSASALSSSQAVGSSSSSSATSSTAAIASVKEAESTDSMKPMQHPPQPQPRQANNSAIFINFDENYRTKENKNCSYVSGDVFCDCDVDNRRYSCYNVQSSVDITKAFNHLLNLTRLIYWNALEIHCVEPFVSDEPSTSTSKVVEENVDGKTKQSTTTLNIKSFHISLEIFSDGPKFDSILFVGDCSKPKHYDNLILIDDEVSEIKMIRNVLRMTTSCMLLQPKFSRLNEIIIRDSLVTGDMISSTFSTRCLGQYGTRNEPLPLTKLTISNCNISLIETGAFYNFADLELIDLSHNRISHLSRQVFAPVLYKLRTLKLNNNKLSSLANEFFDKLPSLREINLSNNRLQTLPPISGTVGTAGLAQVLLIANNPWDCRCRLTWLLDEPMDGVRLIADEPKCAQPPQVKGHTLFTGLQTVRNTFC